MDKNKVALRYLGVSDKLVEFEGVGEGNIEDICQGLITSFEQYQKDEPENITTNNQMVC